MNELAKTAAESIGCTLAQCVHIEKFPDGMFNKSFLFTMKDGTQVVGKVPNQMLGGLTIPLPAKSQRWIL